MPARHAQPRLGDFGGCHAGRRGALGARVGAPAEQVGYGQRGRAEGDRVRPQLARLDGGLAVRVGERVRARRRPDVRQPATEGRPGTLNGTIEDKDRTDYLESYLAATAAATALGAPVAGYFAWSLLDNFGWAYGCDKRFGLVYVGYGLAPVSR